MLKRTKEVLGWVKEARLQVVESRGSSGNTMEMQLRADNGSTKWFTFHSTGLHPHAERRAVLRFAEQNRPSPMSQAFAQAEIAKALNGHPTPEQESESPIMAKPTPISLTSVASTADHKPSEAPAKEPLKPADKHIVKITQVQFFRLAQWCAGNVRPGSDETYQSIAARAKEALGFDLSHASIPTALEAVGITLAGAKERMGTYKRNLTRQHHATLARHLLTVMEQLGMPKPADLEEIAKWEAGK